MGGASDLSEQPGATCASCGVADAAFASQADVAEQPGRAGAVRNASGGGVRPRARLADGLGGGDCNLRGAAAACARDEDEGDGNGWFLPNAVSLVSWCVDSSVDVVPW